MLSPEQESSLTSAGDCQEHWHSSDRSRTHDDVRQLSNLEATQLVTSGSFNVDPGADYVVADTSGGNVTLVLPQPSKRLSVTILRPSAANTLTITTPSGLVNGAASFVLAGAYAFAKFKAINENYFRVG